MTSTRRAFLALTAAGLIWGLTVPLSKLALGWLDPAWLTVVRFGVAAPILGLLAWRDLRAAISPRILAWGAVGYGMVILLQNLGIERTSVSHAALILGAVPAMVGLVAFTLGRGSAGPLTWVGFAVAIAGVVLVAGSGGNASVGGDVLVLASAALMALYIVAQRPLLQGRNPVAVTAVQMAAAALAALPVALLGGELPAPHPADAELLAVVLLATFGSLLPYALYAYGQARVQAEVAGAFINLEPLVGAAAAALVFGEHLGMGHFLGAAGILAGIVLSLERPPRRATVPV